MEGTLNGILQFCRHLFWARWGGKRRRAQEEYEGVLGEGKRNRSVITMYGGRFNKRFRTLSIEDFFYSFGLQLRYHWLWKRSNKLDDTIEKVVKPVNGARRLFVKLIHKFKYIDHDHSQECINIIARYIKETWKCDQNTTLIMPVCTKTNRYPDGSLKMVYDLRTALGGWKNKMVINFFDADDSHVAAGCNVILCDDFIGSGSTMEKRIKRIRTKMSPSAKLYVVSLACMREARDSLFGNSGIYAFSPLLLDKGIKDKSGNSVMLSMEALLSPIYNKEEMAKCTLGYGGTGSLYYNEDYRIPNNVYPIFWWGYLFDGRPFNSLFLRP